MEVETRQGVCNNSPAESSSPKNGWRSRILLTLSYWYNWCRC